MRLGDPKNQRRRIVMGAWLVLAVVALTRAAFMPDEVVRFFLILVAAVLLLCFWVALRWPDKL
jgi:hypothetical protein